ncbi:hypothetical protein IPH25_03025 [bacterium]|nr:MAG: hypothetical protein IPG37_00015 [bacterium]QQR61439.1 MAG: hypothetical protein IPH25_03025 [bacterium]
MDISTDGQTGFFSVIQKISLHNGYIQKDGDDQVSPRVLMGEWVNIMRTTRDTETLTKNKDYKNYALALVTLLSKQEQKNLFDTPSVSEYFVDMALRDGQIFKLKKEMRMMERLKYHNNLSKIECILANCFIIAHLWLFYQVGLPVQDKKFFITESALIVAPWLLYLYSKSRINNEITRSKNTVQKAVIDYANTLEEVEIVYEHE